MTFALSPTLRLLLRVGTAERRSCGVEERTIGVAPPKKAPTVEVHRLRSRREFLALISDPRFAPRWGLERHLAQQHQYTSAFAIPGICPLCAQAVDFTGDFAHPWEAPDGLVVPNWRECLSCSRCGLTARQRRVAELAAGVVEQVTAAAPVVYVMEALSPLYRWLARSLAAEVIGSEYLGADARGHREDGIRHEDAERLSFADASLDVVVSCDVFEHVNDPDRAFAEAARVLRPGGRAIFTFPMDPDVDANRRRAELVDGAVHHLLPPVYHGNPLSADGALVFTDFGWEVLADLRRAGFDDPTLELYWSYKHGYLGIQFCFLAGKV